MEHSTYGFHNEFKLNARKKHFFWKCFIWFQNYKNNKNVLAFNKNICFVVILVPAEFFTPECIKTNKWCDCNVLYEHWIRQNVSCHHVLFGKKIESPLTSNRARLWFFLKNQNERWSTKHIRQPSSEATFKTKVAFVQNTNNSQRPS